jgi:hypothetical protein
MSEQTVGEIEPGTVFRTRAGVWAVKSEYRYPNGQCQCVLLASGEYAHWEHGDAEPVALVVDVPAIFIQTPVAPNTHHYGPIYVKPNQYATGIFIDSDAPVVDMNAFNPGARDPE